MTISLTYDSIRARRAAVERQIRDTEQVISSLRAALSDLDASERVLKSLNPQNADLFASDNVGHNRSIQAQIVITKPSGQFGGGQAFSVRNPFRAGTNKAFIWEVLDQSSEPWLNANQIQEAASRMKGEAIPMPSISPMLSEMKGDYLERDNLRVALKSRLNENGADDIISSSAPETALAAQNKEATEC